MCMHAYYSEVKWCNFYYLLEDKIYGGKDCFNYKSVSCLSDPNEEVGVNGLPL